MKSNWPEWLLSADGKLLSHWLTFYAKMLKIPEVHLANLVILPGAQKRNLAETWSENKIKINTQTIRASNDIAWIGTIAHELTHEFDYCQSPLPAFMLRFQQNVAKYFKQYVLGYSHEKAYKSSLWEIRAFSNQQKVMELISKSNFEMLRNPALSDREKEAMLEKLVSEFGGD